MAGNILLNKFAVAKTGINYTRSVFRHHGQHITNILTGKITPMEIIEVLPGSSFSLKFGSVLRSATLVAPVLTDIYCDICAFWVPNRLVMNDFAQFLGENNNRAWTLRQDVDIPTLTGDNIFICDEHDQAISRTYLAEHYLYEHVGWAYKDMTSDASAPVFNSSLHVNILPNRGYDLIYNEWWRDENIIDPVLFSKDSGVNLTIDVSRYAASGGVLHNAARISDMFNKLLPAPQRAGEVPVSIGSYAPVVPLEADAPDGQRFHGNGLPIRFNSESGFSSVGVQLGLAANTQILTGTSTASGSIGSITKSNLWADLSTAAFNVNSLRYSIALQQFYEISARTGMREVEFYAGQWSVSSSDARYARSELLCQKRYRVNVQQVVATADGQNQISSASSNLGDTGAYSVTAFGGDLFTKTFTEYGFIHIQAVVRHANVFSTGFQPYALRYKFFDYPLPVFDHIGEQGAPKLWLQASYDTSNPLAEYLGYMPAWNEWRSEKRTVVGILAPGEPLDYWTLGTAYESVSLAKDFIEQSYKEFDRALVFPVDEGNDVIPLNSNRYQWIISFESFGTKALILSKDSTPAGLGRI